MPALPIGTAAFERSEAPKVVLRNYYYERSPANLEDQVSLKPRPRLKAFAMAGAGPQRGLFRKDGVLGGAILALSAANLFNLGQGDDETLIQDDIQGDRRLSAEGTADVVMLCAGATPYTTDGVTLSTVTMPDGHIANAVGYLAGRFLLASELGRFYWTDVGGIAVSALDYATAESQPDGMMTLLVIGDVLWLFGRTSLEGWQPTGDVDLPFQRIVGRIFGIGVTGYETVQKLNVGGIDTACWVGTDRRVYRMNPNPQKISDAAMDERLQRVTDPEGLTSSGWNWNGHDFYCLHIPGEGSWAYDLSTELWDEVTSYGRSLFRGAVSATGPNAQPLLGDETTGDIWEMSEDDRTDGADPVLFEFTGLLEVPSAAIRLENISLDLSTGLNPDPEADPVMQMAMSGDLGETYGPDFTQPLGRTGERYNVAAWSQLGMLERPGKVIRWRTTEPLTVRKAKYNERLR